MPLLISKRIREKLANKEPPVTEAEIEQCFANRDGAFLLDVREEHRTNPPTKWFISETDHGRKLKVVFIKHIDGDHKGSVEIKSAYSPNDTEYRIYNQYAY